MNTGQSQYAAVVLYHRLGDRIHNTVAGLLAQEIPPTEILIVDNASDDGVLDGFPEKYHSCDVLQMASNVGYGAAMNAGAARLIDRFEYLLLMTHEVVLTPDCVTRLLSVCQNDPDLGMVGPALRIHAAETPWSFGGQFTRLGDVRHNVDEGRAGEAQWLDGACLLIRSAAFTKAGGFDEDYFLYWEDVDLSTKIRAVSRIRCVPSAVAYQSTGTAPIYFRTRNQILFWNKHRQPIRVIAALVAAMVKAIIRDLGGRSPTQARARLLGMVDGLCGRLTTSPLRMVRQG
jgi:N-acetylglucosaminyl-diphospho-decaprenol L-rhamnosyltransferase